MIKSKLIRLLNKFSKEEMKEFGKFISSPFFSRGRNLKPLYSLLCKNHPAFTSPVFTEEKIFKKLYPEKKYGQKSSSHTLQVLASEMTGLAEKFLVYNSIESGKWRYYYNIMLADTYRDKYFFDLVLKVLLKNSDTIDKEEKDNDFYYRRLETNTFLSGVYFTNNKSKESYEYSHRNLLYIYAHIFDLLNKRVNEYFIHKYNNNFDSRGFELVKLFINTFDPVLFGKDCDNDKHETKNITLINYYIIKSRIDENDKEVLMFALNIFTDIFGKISRFSQWNLYALLFNRLFGRIRFDNFYLHKANELIDFVWNKGVFSTHNKTNLHIGSYHTAMTVKAAVYSNEDFREFVMKYYNKVDTGYRADIKNYSFAFYNFKNKSFDKCLELVSRKDSLNRPSLKINKHKLKVCCLYELSFPEEAILAIDTFEHFLRKNRNVSEIVKSENFKFVNGIKKLIRMKLGEMREPDFEMKEVMSLTQNSLWGYWFKEKVEELKCKNQS